MVGFQRSGWRDQGRLLEEVGLMTDHRDWVGSGGGKCSSMTEVERQE